MALSIRSPYDHEALPWLKGNLHAHTTNSDGMLTPQETVDRYAALGHDFLMISDHDHLTDPSVLENRGMALIPGNEITAGGPHIHHVGARTFIPPQKNRQAVIDAIRADGGFAIVNHPNWEKHFNHCPQERLEAWQGYAGIEIYNGLVRFIEGEPSATDRWDRLLGKGRRVWGYANDDCHQEGNYGLAWNVVQSASHDAADIIEALRSGRFYASSGVVLSAIRVEDSTITIETENGQHIAAFYDFGRRYADVDGSAITVQAPEDTACTYLRFQCWGAGESMAWTQPFFLERG